MREEDGKEDSDLPRALVILGLLAFVAFLCWLDKSLWPAWMLVFLALA